MNHDKNFRDIVKPHNQGIVRVPEALARKIAPAIASGDHPDPSPEEIVACSFCDDPDLLERAVSSPPAEALLLALMTCSSCIETGVFTKLCIAGADPAASPEGVPSPASEIIRVLDFAELSRSLEAKLGILSGERRRQEDAAIASMRGDVLTALTAGATPRPGKPRGASL